MVGTTTQCPYCGQATELLLAAPQSEPAIPRRAIVWTVVAVLVLLVGLALALVALNHAQQWAARHPRQTTAPVPTTDARLAGGLTPNDPLAQKGFAVSAVTLETAPGASLVYAVGAVTSISNRQRLGVKVQIDLFNAAGQKIGTATDSQKILEAGAEWHFKAVVLDPKVAAAKLASIEADQ